MLVKFAENVDNLSGIFFENWQLKTNITHLFTKNNIWKGSFILLQFHSTSPIPYVNYNTRDANIHIQEIGMIQTKNREVFKITCKFNGTKLARNRELPYFGVEVTKMFQ